MSGGEKKPCKPSVGVIYSASSGASLESVHFAQYLSAHLSATGYCDCVLVGYSPSPQPEPSLMIQERIRYHPYNSSKETPKEAPASDVRRDYWSALSGCHLIIITAVPEDAEGCAEKIRDNLDSKFYQTAFIMQKGVRSSTTVRDIISSKKHLTAIECAVGFSVIRHPTTGALTTTLPSSSHILIERLTKEMVNTSDGAVNLVETLPFKITFRKTLTTSCWGLAQYDSLSALQMALNLMDPSTEFSTISHCLTTRELRLIYAAMLRESTKCLATASTGGGGWAPDLLLICSSFGTPWLLEMILTMWTFGGFLLVSWLVGFSYSPFASPGIYDHHERKRSLVRQHMQELLSSGEKYRMRMPVTSAVYDRLAQLEDDPSGTQGTDSLFIGELTSLVEEHHVKSKSGSIHEARYWVIRYITILSLLNAAYFLFIH